MISDLGSRVVDCEAAPGEADRDGVMFPASQLSEVARCVRKGDSVGGHVASGLRGGFGDGVGKGYNGLFYLESLLKNRHRSCRLFQLGRSPLEKGASFLVVESVSVIRFAECLRCCGLSQRLP